MAPTPQARLSADAEINRAFQRLNLPVPRYTTTTCTTYQVTMDLPRDAIDTLSSLGHEDVLKQLKRACKGKKKPDKYAARLSTQDDVLKHLRVMEAAHQRQKYLEKKGKQKDKRKQKRREKREARHVSDDTDHSSDVVFVSESSAGRREQQKHQQRQKLSVKDKSKPTKSDALFVSDFSSDDSGSSNSVICERNSSADSIATASDQDTDKKDRSGRRKAKTPRHGRRESPSIKSTAHGGSPLSTSTNSRSECSDQEFRRSRSRRRARRSISRSSSSRSS